MVNRKPKEKRKDHLEATELLNGFAPETELGKKLLELAKQGFQNGVSRLGSDEIREELGRQKYDSDIR
jgi:hypothetical protein